MPLRHPRELFLTLLEDFHAHQYVVRDVDPFAGTSLMFTFRQFMPLEGMPDGIPPTDEPDEPTDRVWEIRDDHLDPQVPRDGNPTSNIPSRAAPEDPYQVPNSPAQETQVVRVSSSNLTHASY